MLWRKYLSLALVAGLMSFGGCVGTGIPGDGSMTAVLEATATAPQESTAGQTIELSASVNEDAGPVTYQWFQVSGRLVELEGAGEAVVRFVAPSLPSDQRLVFRVDVRNAAGETRSSTVEVLVLADPDYVAPDFSGGGGGDEDGETPDPGDEDVRVRMVTSMGEIIVELYPSRAPITVANFLQYVDDGFYNNTIFHRVVPDFVVQGGGFSPGMELKETRDSIVNEAARSGLRNDRGTIAMARQAPADSATSQFYFNLVDNDRLNPREDPNGLTLPGYTVFGRVVSGMSVVDDIGEVETDSRDAPLEEILLIRCERVISFDFDPNK